MNKKYLYSLILILFLILIFVGYIFLLPKIKIFGMQKYIDKALNSDNYKKDPVNMSNNEIYDLINKENKKEHCQYMDSQYFTDLCLEIVAMNLEDLKICSEIKDENIIASCKNSIISKKSIEEKDMLLCGDLETEKKQLACFDNLFSDQTVIRDCDKFIVKKTESNASSWNEYNINQYCKDMVNFRDATKSKDAEKCKIIFWNPLKAQCLSQLKSVLLNSDNDKDELKFFDEIIQGTNPDLPDTDGDGFKDGDEVKNGYSPITNNKE